MITNLVSVLMLIIFSTYASADIYKCTDEKGHVTYDNKPNERCTSIVVGGDDPAPAIPTKKLAQSRDVRWYAIKNPDFSHRGWRSKFSREACQPADLLKDIEKKQAVASASSLINLEVEDGPLDDAGKVNNVRLKISVRQGLDEWKVVSVDGYYRRKAECIANRDLLAAKYDEIISADRQAQSRYK